MSRRILLTGASGFVGSRVARLLALRGDSVALVLRQGSDTRRIEDLLPRTTTIRADLQDIQLAREAVQAFKPDTVAHLAWHGVKGTDRNAPAQPDNVSHSVALYRLSRSVGVRRFVGLGSQAEYGPCQQRISERQPTAPTTTYGAAKLATYLLLDRMAAADGVSFAWLRLFSSYGPDDDPSWLIPYLTLQLLSESRPALTLAEQRWDYVHVDDVAAAVVAMIDSDANGPYNLGSGEAWPLRRIVTTIRDLIDPDLPLGFGDLPYRSDQVMHLEADISALTAATGWRPAVSLERGLRETVAWYRHHTNAS